MTIDLNRIPRHIAVIMDGNGRWAQRQGKNRLEGHTQGYVALKNTLQAASDLGVEYLSAYAFSSENWNRPPEEVNGIMEIIRYAAAAELQAIKDMNVRMVLSGRVQDLPEATRNQLLQDCEETKDNNGITLNLAVNYGGRQEIVDAAKKLLKLSQQNLIKYEDINQKYFSQLLYHPEIPDPDLMIRTAGELRTSNFLLWECAYTEIHVTDTLWPDFGEKPLLEAILDFQSRTRKFGKTAEQVKN